MKRYFGALVAISCSALLYSAPANAETFDLGNLPPELPNFSDCDTDHDGKIAAFEFISCITIYNITVSNYNLINNSSVPKIYLDFTNLDNDNNGYIDQAEYSLFKSLFFFS